jgi:hypothetical protein
MVFDTHGEEEVKKNIGSGYDSERIKVRKGANQGYEKSKFNKKHLQ